MKILITGSSGQIGTNLGIRLLEEGHHVFGIDRRPNNWTDRIRTLIGDLSEGNLGERLEEHDQRDFDVVVHLAAHAKVHELVVHPDRAFDNVKSVFQVLEYCRLSETPILFGSSREVYGDIHSHQTDEGQADFVVAESPYSASKIAGEALIYSYYRCYDLPYLVFRFSNVYGRFDCDLERMERVVPLFIDRLSGGMPITIYGPEKVFDFTYVDDCVNGVVQGIEAVATGKVKNETFNLACGEGHTLDELAKLICREVDANDPEINYELSRRGEVLRYVADISKARRLLGYDPRVSLPAGIPLAVRSFRLHDKGS